MQKPLALSIAACLGLAGCQVFQKSDTWEQAVRVQAGDTLRDPDPSHAYAEKLHAVFAERGIEHKVVVYQYRYMTRRREEAVGTRTAVIYRDNSNPRYPWWLKDDRSPTPLWLPNGDPDKQVSFYVRRKAEVIETKEYPGHGGSGKSTVAVVPPAPSRQIAAKPSAPAPVTRIAPAKKVAFPFFRVKPAPATEIVRTPEVKKQISKVAAIQPRVIKESAPKPAPKTALTRVKPTITAAPEAPFFAPPPTAKIEAAPVAPALSRNEAAWAPPGALDTRQQAELTAPRDNHLEKLFRAKHGSDYNRFSPIDRRKMQRLQNGVASRE